MDPVRQQRPGAAVPAGQRPGGAGEGIPHAALGHGPARLARAGGRDRRYDDGIAAQTLLLGAAERGYGGCMLGLVDRPVLAEALGIDPQRYQVDLVVALGVPAEEIRLTEAGRDGDVTYYRDGQVHCVPKRPLDALIV